MLHLFKLAAAAVVGIWAAFRAVEEGFAAWVRRETRQREAAGLAPA
ncbi:hypothetical protein [Egicoccus halophilus]|uniref:Uncharacterized protein n=1 Tax=Egicoccus halophilus TaxID=1670830 RepID=A0A8J3AB44_9ACTN|nr:hypothetical protein [Egicoccus halophilus]GGI07037.1 hypothetical protein GCM10011354_22090 [Egicoccus halophilus]